MFIRDGICSDCFATLLTSTKVPFVVTCAITDDAVLTMKSGTIKHPECSVDLSG